MIHPTAIIHPKAQIGAGCEIGPYCVIGEHVALGDNCKLHSHVVIDGHTKLGKENEIFPFASIGLKTQDLKWKGGVTRTGNRRSATRSANTSPSTARPATARSRVVGSHNTILAYCHIAHNCTLGNHIIMSNVATLAGHVIGGGLRGHRRTGGGASILPHRQDGDDWRLLEGGAGRAAVHDGRRQSRPRRAPSTRSAWNATAFPRRRRRALRQAYKILFREGLTISNALAKIEKELPPLAGGPAPRSSSSAPANAASASNSGRCFRGPFGATRPAALPSRRSALGLSLPRPPQYWSPAVPIPFLPGLRLRPLSGHHAGRSSPHNS